MQFKLTLKVIKIINGDIKLGIQLMIKKYLINN